MSAREVLAELQRRIDEIEDGTRTSSRTPMVRVSEVADARLLDGLVPGIGLGLGASLEVIGGPSSGKVGLALGWVASVTSAGSLAIWIDLPGTFYPPAAECVGVALPRLLVVSPANERDAAHACGVALASGVFGAVVADWGPAALPLSEASARRLCVRAREGRSAFYLLTTGAEDQLGFRADVRLREVGPPNEHRFRVERTRPAAVGRAPWVQVGTVMSVGSDRCPVEPIWEREP
jgi:hypothetical protein